MNKLPDPWILNTEKLLEKLEKCREKVMNIPIRSLEETQLGIRYALTEICNLQEHLRFVLLLHREAQQRFARKADELATDRQRLFHAAKSDAKASQAQRAKVAQ